MKLSIYTTYYILSLIHIGHNSVVPLNEVVLIEYPHISTEYDTRDDTWNEQYENENTTRSNMEVYYYEPNKIQTQFLHMLETR
jgi:hypothetical protein